MSLNEQIDRLYTVKSDLFSAINAKGGNLTVNQSISEYAAAVIALPSGGGGEIVFPQVTVTADKLLSGVTATNSNGEVVTGTIKTVKLSQSGNTVSIAKGYTEGGSITIDVPPSSGGYSKAQLFCATLIYK